MALLPERLLSDSFAQLTGQRQPPSCRVRRHFANKPAAYIPCAGMNLPGAPQDRVLAGIGLMLAGIFFFALNDALGKWLIATYSVGQLLLVRSAAGLVFLAPFIKREGW